LPQMRGLAAHGTKPLRDAPWTLRCAEPMVIVLRHLVAQDRRQAVHNRGFNVGRTAGNLRIRDIALIVQEEVPDCRVEFSCAAADKRCYRVNCDHLRQTVPSFQPIWDMGGGVRQLCQALRDARLTADEFESPDFQLIAHVRQRLEHGELDASLRCVRGPELSVREVVQ